MIAARGKADELHSSKFGIKSILLRNCPRHSPNALSGSSPSRPGFPIEAFGVTDSKRSGNISSCSKLRN